MSKTLHALLLAAVFSVGSLPAAWADNPPTQVLDSIPEAKKLGNTRFTWFGLHVYDAQLWAAGTSAQFDYKQQPSWLELRYGRDFDGADIASRSKDEMENLGAASADKLKVWEKKLVEVFPNVKKGDALSALYQPGMNLQFFHNGKPLATITDLDLARSFMGIWLDPKTSEPAMRKKLIGQR